MRKRIENDAKLLEEYYGEKRNPMEDGGFIAIVDDENEKNLIFRAFNLQPDYPAEYEDIVVDGEHKFMESLFIVSSDFNIVIFEHLKEKG